MVSKLNYLIAAGILLVLAGCGEDGREFEGKWSCGKLSISIRNNGVNEYIIDNYPIIGKVSVAYTDGRLVGQQGVSFSIDKKSGRLIGMNICEMTREK